MARFKFVCLVNAREGQDAAFNAWHTNVHIPEVVREAGFTSGKRMKVVKGLEGDARIYQYLVIYEGEIANPELALNKLGEAVAAGRIQASDTLDPVVWTAVYEDIPGAEFSIG